MNKLKVLIVDDSRIFRGVIQQILEESEEFEVIGSAFNGLKAMESLLHNPPDLVTLDVEMPEMDGFKTLTAIQEYNRHHPERPEIGVLMVSSHTHKGAETTIRALELGAFDFVSKPGEKTVEENVEKLRGQLVLKLRMFGVRYAKALSRLHAAPVAAPKPAEKPRPVPKSGTKALAIGVSTGGPKALSQVLPLISELTDLPIFIVQHMPPVFTQSLATSLAKKCTRHKVVEAQQGQLVEKGMAYLAPGDFHMQVIRDSMSRPVIELIQTPPENGCRPAVDVMFRSLAPIYGGSLLAMVLTGMGTDGTKGLQELKKTGTFSIAQDEPSSVVWGMPGSVVQAGLADVVLPLMDIPDFLKQML
ncbi:MAG: chemotaxis response regulator protein-glutamate methylesterase [Deltaproteobacteria bacterium]|nr:chemotaxis response regulator protein-glutamate methylesterase [Deltaproteobacteria bacterium]